MQHSWHRRIVPSSHRPIIPLCGGDTENRGDREQGFLLYMARVSYGLWYGSTVREKEEMTVRVVKVGHGEIETVKPFRVSEARVLKKIKM